MIILRLFAILFSIFLACVAAGAQEAVPVPSPRPDPADSSSRPGAEEGIISPSETHQIYQNACPALLSGRVTGRMIPPIDEDGCGTPSPLIVTALGQGGMIRLDGEPIMNCAMAEALTAFASAISDIAREELGSPLASLSNGPGYECRRRNRESSGKMSEHAFADAIDISSFRLADGRLISVENDWPHLPAGSSSGDKPPKPTERAASPEAVFLAKSHAFACRLFTTVLGPDSNAAHRSHFHLDLGCHGRDCTYLICE